MEISNVPQFAPNYEPRDVNLDEEMRLFTTSEDRDKYDNMAGLYSIIILMENIEKAYANNAIKAKEYTQECEDLIIKYKTTINYLSDSVPHVETFMHDYKLTCKAAFHRFVKGVPATKEHMKDDNALQVFDLCSNLITLMDALELGRRKADDLKELIKGLPTDTESIASVRKWYSILKEMRSEELSDEQMQQFASDLRQTFDDYRDSLGGQDF